jgi:hypothetical protein
VLNALLVVFAVVAGADDTPSLYTDVRPPVQFQGNTSVVLDIQNQKGIDRLCHPLFGRPPAGMKTDACQTGRKVIAPNPCDFPATETYARLLCHEIGHANGWPRTHGGYQQTDNADRYQGGAGSRSR